MKLSVIVRYCDNLKLIREFYEMFGLVFVQEEHENGLIHYATDIGGIVFELYPRPLRIEEVRGINHMLGIKIDNLDNVRTILEDNRILYIDGPMLKVRDPEGSLLLIEEEKE